MRQYYCFIIFRIIFIFFAPNFNVFRCIIAGNSRINWFIDIFRRVEIVRFIWNVFIFIIESFVETVDKFFFNLIDMLSWFHILFAKSIFFEIEA